MFIDEKDWNVMVSTKTREKMKLSLLNYIEVRQSQEVIMLHFFLYKSYYLSQMLMKNELLKELNTLSTMYSTKSLVE